MTTHKKEFGDNSSRMADVKFSCAKSAPAFCAAPGLPLWELEGDCGFEHWAFSGSQMSRKELGRFFLPQQRDGPVDGHHILSF